MVHGNELYDGTNKPDEEYNLDTYNALTYQAMIGKSENEREAAAAMMQVLRATETLSSDETRKIGSNGTDAEKSKTKCVNDLLYAMLAMSTTGRAKQIVKETASQEMGQKLG